MRNPYEAPRSEASGKPRGALTSEDPWGVLLVASPFVLPLLSLLSVVGWKLALELVGVVSALVAAFDCGPRKQPRWVWVPLLLAFWPMAIPAYVFVRSRSRGRVPWAWGLFAILGAVALFFVGVRLGRV